MSGGSPEDKRVGDETLQRIDDLAGGWSLPRRARREGEEPSPAPQPAADAGQTARKAAGSTPVPAERGRVTSKKKKPREKTRAKGKERGKTAAARRPDPPALARAVLGTELPPEGPRDAQSRSGGDSPGGDVASGETERDDRVATEVSDRAATRLMSERIATEISDRAATRVSDRAATRVVADRAETEVSDHAATMIYGERSATEIDGALDGAPTTPRGSKPAADRSDETVLEAPGSGAYAVARADKIASTTAILRLPPTLPRRRGVFGDVLYLYTAMVGVARTNRELSAAERKLEAEKQARIRRLADLARLALADTALVSETVARGRDEIMDLEDRRSRRAGAAAGAESEIAGLERDREEADRRHTQELDALRGRVKEMEEKLEPLQHRMRAARRRAIRLQENLDKRDRRLGREQGRLAKLAPDQVTGAEANMASLRAERRGMAQELPVLAAELDDLEPAIASLIAALADARVRATRIEKEKADSVVRTAEKVTAAKACRVVDERAESELAQAQEDALRALGERLGVERPAELATRLRGIEEHEVAIATLERRHLELTELVKAVDRWALVRGVLWLLAILVAVAAALVWSVALRAL